MFTKRSALLFWQPVNRPEMMENLPEMETNGKEGDQEMQSQKCSFISVKGRQVDFLLEIGKQFAIEHTSYHVTIETMLCQIFW